MEDKSIIDLYVRRDERAITETSARYGAYCAAVAGNILGSQEDAEEIVNDVWLAVWYDIPPSKPKCLRAYLGRIVRNLAITRYRQNHAQKRWDGMETLLSELGECIRDPKGVERQLEVRELSRVLQSWVDGLAPDERRLFVRRYWYGVAVNRLAWELGVSENAMTQRLLRLRRSLRARLEQEGVEL